MKKDIFIVILIIIAVVAAYFLVDIQSVDEYYLANLESITADSKTVFLSIDCKAILPSMHLLDPNLRDFVPQNGIILPKTEYVLRPNDSVFDVLNRAIRHNKIHFEHDFAYIKGINQLYELSAGPLSGWMYCVNGDFPSASVSAYILADKDEIELKYTCDLGRDIGNLEDF